MAYINKLTAPWFTKFVSGMKLTYVSATSFTVSAGTCSNSTDENIITLETDITVSTAVDGAGGIDNGTLAASTEYHVFAVGDSSSVAPQENTYQDDDYVTAHPGSVVMSTSDAPGSPLYYDMYRYIGTVYTDGSSNIRNFVQSGEGVSRTMWYDAAINVLSSGSSATYAGIDLSTAVPRAGLEVILLATFTPTAAADALNVIPYSSTATVGYASVSGSVAAVATTSMLRVPCTANTLAPSIKYKVTGSATSIGVAGYIDQL